MTKTKRKATIEKSKNKICHLLHACRLVYGGAIYSVHTKVSALTAGSVDTIKIIKKRINYALFFSENSISVF